MDKVALQADYEVVTQFWADGYKVFQMMSTIDLGTVGQHITGPRMVEPSSAGIMASMSTKFLRPLPSSRKGCGVELLKEKFALDVPAFENFCQSHKFLFEDILLQLARSNRQKTMNSQNDAQNVSENDKRVFIGEETIKLVQQYKSEKGVSRHDMKRARFWAAIQTNKEAFRQFVKTNGGYEEREPGHRLYKHGVLCTTDKGKDAEVS